MVAERVAADELSSRGMGAMDAGIITARDTCARERQGIEIEVADGNWRERGFELVF